MKIIVKSNIKFLIMVFIVGFFGGLAALGISELFDRPQNQAKITDTYINSDNQTSGVLTGGLNAINDNPDFTVAADLAINGVVHVKTKIYQDVDNPLYQFFFGDQGGQLPLFEGAGSGVIVSDDGYIVTNNHVIDGAANIDVVLNDRREFKARLIGRDPSTDLALLKIEAKDLTVIPFGNSDDVKIGEWVLAIGNPFNLTSTVTAGIVSAKARDINILDKRNGGVESFIQTDAAVNPGNSGGALLDTKGYLIGINTAIASKTGSFTGYSFAVPVSIVKKVIADLTEYGTVQRAVLGAKIQEITAELASQYRLSKIEGVLISEVYENGAAKLAGIEKDDIIVKVESHVIHKISELQEQLNRYRPGDKVVFTVLRNNKPMEISVTMRNTDGNTSYKTREVFDILGATFEQVSSEDLAVLRVKNGVRVVEVVAGKMLKAGIKPNFVITSINNEKIYSIEDLQRIVNETRGGIYIEGVYPGGVVAYYAFGLR